MMNGIVRALERAAAALADGLERTGLPWLNPLARLVRARALRQFVRFLAVGSLNFVFYYSVFTGLHLLRLSPTAAVVAATVVAVLFNFITTGRVVFADGRLRLLPRFVAVYLVQMLLNIGALRLLIAMGAPVLVAEAAVIGVLAVLTFFALKHLVFDRAGPPGRAAASVR